MRKLNLHSLSCLSLLIVVALSSCLSQENQKEKNQIAEWRGPNRTGIYNETGLQNQWPENGPELLWVYNGIGNGYAAPSVLNNRVYVNGERDSSSFLFAFDLLGNLIWEAPNGKEFMGEGFSSTYPGSRSTPTVVNDLVYATSGTGRLACLDAATGTEKWSVDMLDEYNSSVPYFGFSESVLVDENNVYIFPGGPKTNMAALNRRTGELVWSSEARKDTFSYCSPIFAELQNRKVLITHSRHNLYALDCANGKPLGSYSIRNYQYDGEHCNSPLYENGEIFFIGNEKEDGAIKLKLEENGEKITEVWRNTKIKNNFNGYVKVDNRLFTTVKGNWLKALDVETGAVTDSVKAATGSIIYANNKFICYGMNGDLNLISYIDNKLEVKSTFKIKEGTGHHFSHPVLADGVMYIRHGNALLAYNIK